MNVLLRIAGAYQIADCDFGGQEDMASLSSWRRQLRGPRDEAAQDALEFAAIARKRWRSYTKLERTAANIESVRDVVATSGSSEVAMLAALRCVISGMRRLVGFALFRRTWCNHIIVDLLAANPATSDAVERSGVGLMYFVTTIAEALGSPFIWGEATKGSAPYYQNWFHTKSVDDLFRINASTYRAFAARYREIWKESGLPTG